MTASPTAKRAFRTSRDFSVEAYQQFEATPPRVFGLSTNAVRALGRIAGTFMQRLLAAMHESRRKQAAAVIGQYSAKLYDDA